MEAAVTRTRGGGAGAAMRCDAMRCNAMHKLLEGTPSSSRRWDRQGSVWLANPWWRETWCSGGDDSFSGALSNLTHSAADITHSFRAVPRTTLTMLAINTLNICQVRPEKGERPDQHDCGFVLEGAAVTKQAIQVHCNMCDYAEERGGDVHGGCYVLGLVQGASGERERERERKRGRESERARETTRPSSISPSWSLPFVHKSRPA